MGQKYKSQDIFESQGRFSDGQPRIGCLENPKCPNGFKSGAYGNIKCCKGAKSYSRQCAKCKNRSLSVSGMPSRKVKFLLLKTFYIVRYMSTSKKGINNTELNRNTVFLGQKTCRMFIQKAMKEMSCNGQNPLVGNVGIVETAIGGIEKKPNNAGIEKKQRNGL